MAIVIRNEADKPYHFGGGRQGSARKELAPGDIDTISEDELDSIPFSQRGEGRIRILHPNQSTSTNPHIKLDYYDFGGSPETRYMGIAPQGVETSEPYWVVRRFDYDSVSGQTKITDIQVFEDVAWDDRASLSWV